MSDAKAFYNPATGNWTTIHAALAVEPPDEMDGWTGEQILAAMTASDLYFTPDSAEERAGMPSPNSYAMAYLQMVFDAICDPRRWKNGVYVRQPAIPAEWIRAAWAFYQGEWPTEYQPGCFRCPPYACD